MEIIKVEGEEIAVDSIEMFRRDRCEIMKCKNSDRYFIGYLVSVGPTKFDLLVYRELDKQMKQEYLAGIMDVVKLAHICSHEDQSSGKYERS